MNGMTISAMWIKKRRWSGQDHDSSRILNNAKSFLNKVQFLSAATSCSFQRGSVPLSRRVLSFSWHVIAHRENENCIAHWNKIAAKQKCQPLYRSWNTVGWSHCFNTIKFLLNCPRNLLGIHIHFHDQNGSLMPVLLYFAWGTDQEILTKQRIWIN